MATSGKCLYYNYFLLFVCKLPGTSVIWRAAKFGFAALDISRNTRVEKNWFEWVDVWLGESKLIGKPASSQIFSGRPLNSFQQNILLLVKVVVSLLVLHQKLNIAINAGEKTLVSPSPSVYFQPLRRGFQPWLSASYVYSRRQLGSCCFLSLRASEEVVTAQVSCHHNIIKPP